MLNKLYNKLNSLGYTIEKEDNSIHLYANEKDVHVYIENDQLLEVFYFDDNNDDECVGIEFFDNENTAYYHIRGFLY